MSILLEELSSMLYVFSKFLRDQCFYNTSVCAVLRVTSLGRLVKNCVVLSLL